MGIAPRAGGSCSARDGVPGTAVLGPWVGARRGRGAQLGAPAPGRGRRPCRVRAAAASAAAPAVRCAGGGERPGAGNGRRRSGQGGVEGSGKRLGGLGATGSRETLAEGPGGGLGFRELHQDARAQGCFVLLVSILPILLVTCHALLCRRSSGRVLGSRLPNMSFSFLFYSPPPPRTIDGYAGTITELSVLVHGSHVRQYFQE